MEIYVLASVRPSLYFQAGFFHTELVPVCEIGRCSFHTGPWVQTGMEQATGIVALTDREQIVCYTGPGPFFRESYTGL